MLCKNSFGLMTVWVGYFSCARKVGNSESVYLCAFHVTQQTLLAHTHTHTTSTSTTSTKIEKKKKQSKRRLVLFCFTIFCHFSIAIVELCRGLQIIIAFSHSFSLSLDPEPVKKKWNKQRIERNKTSIAEPRRELKECGVCDGRELWIEDHTAHSTRR